MYGLGPPVCCGTLSSSVPLPTDAELSGGPGKETYPFVTPMHSVLHDSRLNFQEDRGLDFGHPLRQCLAPLVYPSRGPMDPLRQRSEPPGHLSPLLDRYPNFETLLTQRRGYQSWVLDKDGSLSYASRPGGTAGDTTGLGTVGESWTHSKNGDVRGNVSEVRPPPKTRTGTWNWSATVDSCEQGESSLGLPRDPLPLYPLGESGGWGHRRGPSFV